MLNPNIEATKKRYDAFGAGDLEGALSVFDKFAEWTVNGDSMIGGTYRGKDEIAGLLMRMAEKAVRVEARRFLADGDVVMVLTEVTVAGETSREADVYVFGNGRIVSAVSFGDTAMQERIFGSKRVAARWSPVTAHYAQRSA